jgi:hypothetical protein
VDVVTLAFTSKNDITLVVGPAIRINNLRIRGVYNGHWSGSEIAIPHSFGIDKRDLLNFGGFVQPGAGCWSSSILDEKNLISRRIPERSV